VGCLSRKALTVRRSHSVPWRFPVSTNTAGDCVRHLSPCHLNPHASWSGHHTPLSLLLGGDHLFGRYPTSSLKTIMVSLWNH